MSAESRPFGAIHYEAPTTAHGAIVRELHRNSSSRYVASPRVAATSAMSHPLGLDRTRSPAVTWPLTGRAEELQMLQGALAAPDCAGILLHGPAGVGKSRIAREALSVAAESGCQIRWAVGTSSARAIPLGVFASWVGSDTSNLQLVRGVIESLTSVSRATTVVVGVDDAHLLDELSTFVLHQIVQRGAAKLLLTVRAGDPIPVGIQELWQAADFERLDLQPLSHDETITLVSGVLGGALDPDTADRLWKLTSGNVLYLRNIVEQEVTGNRLVCQDGRWCWIGDPVIPVSLVEEIETRIGALSASAGEVIDALAVGEPVELASLRRIVDPAGIEEADLRGLIALDGVGAGQQVRLAHPLYGEVRRRRAAPLRLRRLRALVATELTRSGDADDVPVLVRRAALSLDSDLDPDADLLVRAAQGAVWLMDLPLADRLADAAIRAGGGAEANFIRAYVLSWLVRGQEADTVLASTPIDDLTDAGRARLAFLRAVNMLFTLADPSTAKTMIDDASHTASRTATNCVDALLTLYWAAMGKPQVARTSWQNVDVNQLPDPVIARMTSWAATVASGCAGQTAEATAAAEGGYDFPIRCFVRITDAHVDALVLAGLVADARERSDRLRRRIANVAGPAWITEGTREAVAGRAALGAGRLDTACSLLGRVVEVLAASGGGNGWRYRCQLSYTIAVAMRGLTAEATAALAAVQRWQHPGWRYLDYEYAIARAWVAACQGATSEAISVVLSAAQSAGADGQFAAEVMCLQTATQFGDGSGAPRLGELLTAVEGPRVSVAASFAAAVHADDGPELSVVSEEFERLGDLVAAADAAAHAALAFRRKGLRGSALKFSIRADALAERCGGACTPAIRQAGERLPLTSREREIAALLGVGLSSPAIAQRLTLSVRTIEGHIYRAMAKTGTTSREELGALVRPLKPD